MRNWLNENAAAIQAGGAIVSAFVAVAAFAAIFWQVTESSRIAREQSARDIYREFLNLSIQNPDFAAPDACALARSPRAAAYDDYVGYMLYTAEQALSVSADDWMPVVGDLFNQHARAICSIDDTNLYTPQAATLIEAFQSTNCQALPPCQ